MSLGDWLTNANNIFRRDSPTHATRSPGTNSGLPPTIPVQPSISATSDLPQNATFRVNGLGGGLANSEGTINTYRGQPIGVRGVSSPTEYLEDRYLGGYGATEESRLHRERADRAQNEFARMYDMNVEINNVDQEREDYYRDMSRGTRTEVRYEQEVCEYRGMEVMPDTCPRDDRRYSRRHSNRVTDMRTGEPIPMERLEHRLNSLSNRLSDCHHTISQLKSELEKYKALAATGVSNLFES